METFDFQVHPPSEVQLIVSALERKVSLLHDEVRALVQDQRNMAVEDKIAREEHNKCFAKVVEQLDSVLAEVTSGGGGGGGSGRRVRVQTDAENVAISSPMSPASSRHNTQHHIMSDLCSYGSDLSLGPSRHGSPRPVRGSESRARKQRHRRASAMNVALPMSWPETVEMRPLYANEPPPDSAALMALVEAARSPQHEVVEAIRSTKSVLQFHDHQTAPERKRRPWVLHPTSGKRLIIDIISLLVLAYDLIVTPYVLAFNAQSKEPFVTGAMVTLIFWTVSIFINFRSGFYNNGEVELGLKNIALHYFSTWFGPDAFLVLTDWVSMAALLVDGVGGGDGKYAAAFTLLRFSKAGRLLRLLGIFRMARFTNVMIRIADRCLTSTAKSMIETMGFVFALLWVNHLISCAWVSLASIEYADTELHWTDASLLSGSGRGIYSDASDAYQYFTALHWSLTQMSPGSMQINPLNTIERVFTVLCLILGILCSGSIVSTLTAKMMQMMMANQDRMRKVNVLRRFLRQKRVNPRLAIDVQKMVMERMSAVRPLTPSDVSALGLLSLSLRAELQEELTKGEFTKYPFFRTVEQMDVTTVKAICSAALDFVVLPTNDNLFLVSSDANDMYLVLSGLLSYLQEPNTSMVAETMKKDVEPNYWLCEAALWCVWSHVGTVEALQVTELLQINIEKVNATMQKHQVIRILAAEYCRAFTARLIASIPPLGDWPSDLYVPFTDFGEIVLSMVREARIITGLSALEKVRSSRKNRFAHGAKALQRLEDELYTGQSAVILSGPESLERVIGVSALHLEDTEKRLLVQVGVYDPDLGTITPKCTLPGTKMAEMETPAEALKNRVIGDELAPLADQIITLRSVKEVDKVFSEQYQVPTKYLRTKFHAHLEGDFHLEGVVFWTDLGDAPSTTTTVTQGLGRGFMGRQLSERRPSSDSRLNVVSIEEARYVSRPTSLFILMTNEMKPRVFAWIEEDLFTFWSSPHGKGYLETFLSTKKIEQEHFEAAQKLLEVTKQKKQNVATAAVEVVINSDDDEYDMVSHSPGSPEPEESFRDSVKSEALSGRAWSSRGREAPGNHDDEDPAQFFGLMPHDEYQTLHV